MPSAQLRLVSFVPRQIVEAVVEEFRRRHRLTRPSRRACIQTAARVASAGVVAPA